MPRKTPADAKSSNPYNVAIGQVWQDCDKRIKPPRTLTITRVFRDRGVAVANTSTNRIVEIRLDRFRPLATGYRLLHEPPAAS